MTYRIFHRTQYEYREPVTVSNHTVHLRPRIYPGQQILESSILIEPEPLSTHEYLDYFGNSVMFFTIEQQHAALRIDCSSTVEVSGVAGGQPVQSPPWERVASTMTTGLTNEALRVREFIFPSALVPLLDEAREYAKPCFQPGRPLMEAALELNAQIFSDFTFDNTATTVSTPVIEVFQTRKGVCQDFAHLFLCCLRSMGLAARYVSGYMRTLPPPGGARIFGADASHAWIAVFCPGQGWIELDPTNNRPAELDYVVLGWGRDYTDVSLVRGVLSGGGTHDLTYSVDMSEVP